MKPNRKDLHKKPPKLAHRHFAFIASVIADLEAISTPADVASAFSRACRSTNPKFDGGRFIAACGCNG